MKGAVKTDINTGEEQIFEPKKMRQPYDTDLSDKE
jgi:hypothetical protein